MKRPPINLDGEPAASPGSKRRRRISSSDDEDNHKLSKSTGLDQNPPMHKIYNSACRKEKPAELFRKDLISAMKLPDSEQLDEDDYWDVSDTWKQEWERGVQVPVNSKLVPNPNVRTFRSKLKSASFKLPKKFIRTSQDSFFSEEHHHLLDTSKEAENVCKYDMDSLDCEWLRLFNQQREDWGFPPIEENTMELVLENFETQCSKRFQDALKREKGLGIEYDEDVICDVCRSPDCEEGNEMVFCDACNICVHQACYGIMAIPEGSWVCRPCALNLQPSCILCPNTGGAMKSTGSTGENWAHVSCALWIPEVSIGCPEKMEPIQRISHIPASRWALICTLCRERVGACIQCSVKQCKVAYHVTCAFENGLSMEMKTTPVDSQEQGVKMQSYCSKHCKSDEVKPETPVKAPVKRGRKKRTIKNKGADGQISEVDEHNARLQKIRSLEAQFNRFVNIRDISETSSLDRQVVEFMFHYWVLKRRAKFNKPLLITKSDETNILIKQENDVLYSRLKLFVHLRQDLERVRNLCYMVSRREKLFRAYLRSKSDVLEKQFEILSQKSMKLSEKEFEEVLAARAGDSLYDKFYTVELKVEDDEKSRKLSSKKVPNPYAKSYTNNGVHTRSRRHTTSQSTESAEESSELPKLQKCKSEENLSTNSQSKDISLDLSKLIKVETTQDSDTKTKANFENLFSSHKKEMENVKEEQDSTDQTIHAEDRNSNEASSDKTFLSLSDKENISAPPVTKTRKAKSQQLDIRHRELRNLCDFASQKSDDLIIESNLIGITEGTEKLDLGKGTYRSGLRSTRYQMRIRDYGTNEKEEMLEVEPPLLKSGTSHDEDVKAPDEDAKLSFNDVKLDAADPATPPRRRRGRPRRVPLQTSLVQENLPVTPTSETPEIDDSSHMPGYEIYESSNLSENSTCLRMSLRHCPRESTVKNSERRTRVRKKSTSQAYSSDASDGKSGIDESQSSPEWDGDDPPSRILSSVDPPASPRLVIRLRKDPNRETWKNDSSSSSDVPAAFRIVRNDWDVEGENAVSQFSPRTRHGSADRNDSENKHRYLMRERSVPQRNLKYAFGRS